MTDDSINTITFSPATVAEQAIIFSWLAEPYVQAFWDNTQAHKDDIMNFITGRKTPSPYCQGKYSYWIACHNAMPYAILMTIQETTEDNIGDLKKSHLSKTGQSYGIDFMIGNPDYVGRGYGANTLIAFIEFFRIHVDKQADTFFIDPAQDNPKAKHVYEKAGFKHVGDFMMTGDCSGAGKWHHLLVKQFTPHQSTEQVVVNITTELVSTIIAEQFPEFAQLDIQPIAHNGIDNRTFHLGDDKLIRLPSAQGYAAQVLKEQQWLPVLQQHLTMPIPKPLHLGQPSQDFPWHWSIYQFIPGTSLNHVLLNQNEKCTLAHDLASFIKALHSVPTNQAPAGGLHNYYRGCHPSVYDDAFRADIQNLEQYVETKKAFALWETARQSKWQKAPVWVHGDIATGNLLMQNQNKQEEKLSAVIDFGCMAIGDPACDLVIAWTFFDGEARDVFIHEINLDEATWHRARAWALWKASFELITLDDKSAADALEKIKIIEDILKY